MAKFKWAKGSRVKGSAQEIGERLSKIRQQHQGRLTPEAVLDDASDEASPLHPAFVWDDTEAAHRFRIQQAGQIIRAVVVVVESAEKVGPVRAFVSVRQQDDDAPSYTTIEHAMSDESLRTQVIAQALAEANEWKQRYKQYGELAKIVEAIEDTQGVAA